MTILGPFGIKMDRYRQAWRWRQLYLRALIDAELAKNRNLPNDRCQEAFAELIEIYHAQKAVRGGHYSAIAPSCSVGPEGGQILVDRTVEIINSLWTKPK